MLSQLIYLSVRASKCTDEEIEKILASSNKNNGDRDITGVLLYSQKKFIQVLEGEKDEILKLYDEIKKDDRHINVIMVSLKPIGKRYFPSWEMGSKKIDTETYEFLTDMDEKSKREFKALLNGKEQNNAIQLINRLFT